MEGGIKKWEAKTWPIKGHPPNWGWTRATTKISLAPNLGQERGKIMKWAGTVDQNVWSVKKNWTWWVPGEVDQNMWVRKINLITAHVLEDQEVRILCQTGKVLGPVLVPVLYGHWTEKVLGQSVHLGKSLQIHSEIRHWCLKQWLCKIWGSQLIGFSKSSADTGSYSIWLKMEFGLLPTITFRRSQKLLLLA